MGEGRQDAIVVTAYDASWPDRFDEQRSVVAAALGLRLARPVEHIGSTAVPGLPAKPIVDMLAVVDDIDGVTEVAGWRRADEPGEAERRKRSFCFPSVEHRTHHLHVVEQTSSDWRDWLLFRDFLRAHPDEAAAYSDLKRGLAEADDQDRRRYRAGKAPWITGAMARARAWRMREAPAASGPTPEGVQQDGLG